MSGEMAEHLDFTRADADRITRMETLLIGMDQKIDELTASIQTCQINCGLRRTEVGKRVKELEDQQKEEDGILKGRKADIALVLGGSSFVVTCIAIWRFFKS